LTGRAFASSWGINRSRPNGRTPLLRSYPNKHRCAATPAPWQYAQARLRPRHDDA
jgi:hypothetical protein